jgi:hypothetical protein
MSVFKSFSNFFIFSISCLLGYVSQKIVAMIKKITINGFINIPSFILGNNIKMLIQDHGSYVNMFRLTLKYTASYSLSPPALVQSLSRTQPSILRACPTFAE